ncbi:MAG: hypothetical protein M9894_32775 [Planctomycetes bacterium]|nr:hypothetical protein [Planctomycetota bacterium]
MSEKTVLAGSAVALALMVGFVAWRQVTRPHRPPPPPPTASAPAPGSIVTISTGERVDLAAHLPERGRTVVEFTADW